MTGPGRARDMMMETVAEIEEQVKRIILRSFLPETAPEALGSSDDLFALLDSLQVLRLVQHLEAKFGIQVTDDELTADNLGSVEKMAAFVARKHR
jgi:acyl carrier protein